MGILGKPTGIFDLKNSDKYVGSYISRDDIKEILNVTDEDLQTIKFERLKDIEVIDERTIQTLWYKNAIPNAIPIDKSSLDEIILISIIRQTFPQIKIERQIRIGRFQMDLKLTLNNKELFIEFDGPSHFAPSQYGPPKEPFRKKEIIEDATSIEVVNWAYWIQRCSTNVRALFDKDIIGYGALWSANVHFGMFSFENSAQIIDKITKRFNAVDKMGYGYFYSANTKDRFKPEHPIIEKIKKGKINIDTILPLGYTERNYWLPYNLQ